jgi:hypothetical protein
LSASSIARFRLRAGGAFCVDEYAVVRAGEGGEVISFEMMVIVAPVSTGPAWTACETESRLREIDCLVITSPDRLARNYVHQMLLLEEWEQCGCQVEFLDRPISQDPHDQLVLQIRGAVAEYERTLIADRMRRGRQAKYRAGILLPWTKSLYGYQLDPDHPQRS